MSYRMTVTAAIATALASISLYSLVSGALWFWAGAGAAAVVGAVGALTRGRPLPVRRVRGPRGAGPGRADRIVPAPSVVARQAGLRRFSEIHAAGAALARGPAADGGRGRGHRGGCRPARAATAQASGSRIAVAGAFLRTADHEWPPGGGERRGRLLP